jgi:hypothetical protein
MTEWTLDLLVSAVEPDDGQSPEGPHARPDNDPLIDLIGATFVDDAELDVVEWFGDRLNEAPIGRAVDVSLRGAGSH